MSEYGWERGTITIPKNQWSAFRKGLLTSWNRHQDEMLEQAKRAFAAAKRASKGVRGPRRVAAQKAAVARSIGCGWDDTWNEPRRDQERFDEMVGGLFDVDGRHARTKLHAPRRASFPKVPVTKDATLQIPSASITFHNASHTVRWNVPENNHAVESARGDWFAKELFAALEQIKWVRGSGGEIVGNDEYNRDAGDGASYTVRSYSKEDSARRAEAASRYGSRFGRW
jgi:hypothetical protein